MMRGRKQSGGAVNLIVVVLMLMVVGAGIALAASMVSTSIGDAVLEDDSTAALYLAESGVEAAVANYSASGACTNVGVGVTANVAFGRGTYTIQSATTAGALCRIVVLGAIGNVVRTIQADVSPRTTVGFDRVSQDTDNNNVALTHSTAGTDRLLLVLVARRISTSPPADNSVTYAGVPLELAAVRLRTVGGANVRSEIWFLPNPALGANTLQIQNANRIVVHAASFTGVDQASPLAVSATTCNDGNSGTAQINMTTVRNNSWLIDSVATEPGGGLSFAFGQLGISTQSAGGPNAVAGGASYRIVATAGASFMRWTFSTRDWAHCGIAVQPYQSRIVNWTEL